MGLTRRTILKALVGSGLVAAAAGEARPLVRDASVEIRLRAFLDTLVPADEYSPSASALGISDALLAAAEGKAYARLIGQGCAWLDRQARLRHRQAFERLSEGQRVSIVRRCEEAAPKSLENVFFRAVRDDLMSRYYAHPGVWPSLGYAGPPQPVGFPDFSSPPRPLPPG